MKSAYYSYERAVRHDAEGIVIHCTTCLQTAVVEQASCLGDPRFILLVEYLLLFAKLVTLSCINSMVMRPFAVTEELRDRFQTSTLGFGKEECYDRTGS